MEDGTDSAQCSVVHRDLRVEGKKPSITRQSLLVSNREAISASICGGEGDLFDDFGVPLEHLIEVRGAAHH